MKIIIPVDGSESANRAVDHVITLAKQSQGLEIHLLNVQIPIRSGHIKMFIGEEQLNDYYRDEGNVALQMARDKLSAAGITYKHFIGVGHLAETIVQYAKEHQIDQIIMGSRGMSALSDFVLGSIATKVIHLASVPVTLIK